MQLQIGGVAGLMLPVFRPHPRATASQSSAVPVLSVSVTSGFPSVAN